MYEYSATLARVVDGDTLEVIIDVGFKITTKQRLRLAYIDTPEIFGTDHESEEYKKGIEARNYVERRLADNQGKMRIETYKAPEKFGRYLSIIRLEDSDISLNDELVRKGYARRVNA